MLEDLNLLRDLRSVESQPRRGSTPEPAILGRDNSIRANIRAGFGVGLLVAIIAGIALYIHPFYFPGSGFSYALDNGVTIGLYAFILYFFWPIFSIAFFVIKNWHWPNKKFMQRFGPVQKAAPLLLASYLLLLGFNNSYPHLISALLDHGYSVPTFFIPGLQEKKVHYYGETHLVNEWSNSRHRPQKPLGTLPFVLVCLGASWILGVAFDASLSAKTRLNRLKQPKRKVDYKQLPFRLWIGRSSGRLAALSHGAGIGANQNIALDLPDAAQNILILGAIGTGKTTRAVHPLLMQLLDQECGGLIFDIKGDFQKAVMEFAKATQRDVTVIGIKAKKMNLLAGLTPEVAASFLKSIFMLNSKSNGDSFWIDTATELCRNSLGVLSVVPEYYSLQGLYQYLFDFKERLDIENKIAKAAEKLDKKDVRLLSAYAQYQERIFEKFDEKVKAGVNATIAQVLSPFNHPELVDAFCSEGIDNVRMEDVLNGAVYLVELPLATWGLGGKVVYTMIKLRFFNVMQQRLTRPEWNQERPVFFLCDEYQEIVSANRDGLSDLNFWDKSRSSKTIGIISAQAVSSFYAAIGDRDIAHALLQNFRQKICFRTEDATTLHYFDTLADKVEVERITYSHTTTSGSTDHPGHFFSSHSDGSSSSENVTYTEKSILNAQLFRTLHPEQAVALLSIHGHSMDDVLELLTIFV